MERSAWPKNLSSSRKDAIKELLDGQSPRKKIRHLFDAHSQTGNNTAQPLIGEALIVNVLRSFSNTLSGSSSAAESYEVLQVPTNACFRYEVSEGSESIHTPVPRAPSNTVGTSEASSLRLQFVTKLPAAIFTSSQIEAEDGTPLRIELFDGRTNERVTSGPLSSIKVEIVVLDGDFGPEEGEDWTETDFSCNIIREREGKGPLVTGELTVVLQGGTGCFRNLIITDDSSWMRSRKFKLGARAVQKVSAEIRIQAARSETFVVKDHRGELNEKHHPPSLIDEVWRLEKVAKDGPLHRHMTSRRINTVQDFLQLYEADASSLRSILGTGIANQIWETIVGHASTCVLDDNKMYSYYSASNKTSILFNSILKVVQATLDGQTCLSLDRLTHSQKILMQNLKWEAYNNKNEWVPLDALPSITPLMALTNLHTEPLVSLSPPPHHLDYPMLNQENLKWQAYNNKNQWVPLNAQPSITPPIDLTNLNTEPLASLGPPLHHLDYTMLNQDRPKVTPGFNYSLASTSHCYNVTKNRQLDCLGPQSHIVAEIFNPTIANSLVRQDCSSSFIAGESSNHRAHSLGPFAPNIHLSPEELFKVPSPILNLMWTPKHTFVMESSSAADLGICPSDKGFAIHKSRISRPRVAWCMIRAVVKWRSVMRISRLSILSAGKSSNHPAHSQGSFAPNIHLSPEELFKVPSPILCCLMWTPEHTFVVESSSGADLGICPSDKGFGIHKSRISRPRAAWCKLRAAVKWLFLRRIMAPKRSPMFNFPNY